MPRPKCLRCVSSQPLWRVFKPAGMPMADLKTVTLTLDELESLRLADLLALHQEDAAAEMGVSRATFGRIVEQARRKVASALIDGSALHIERGTVIMVDNRKFRCFDCEHEWEVPHGTGHPAACPGCGSTRFQRSDAPRGPQGPKGGRGRHGCCRGSGRGRSGNSNVS